MRYGAGVLFDSPGGVLLLRRSSTPRYWEFPGGGGEARDPTVWSTARREILEEVGVLLSGYPPEGDHFLMQDGDFVYTTFVVDTDMFKPLLSKEHTEYIWEPASRALNRNLHPGVRQVLRTM